METTCRKRCKRYDIDGQAHCLTFSCFQRQPFLSRDRCCSWMLEGLQLGREKGMFDLWGYVIMPEHVHIVLLPKSGMKISRILTTIKQSVSKRAILWIRQNAPDFLKRMEDIQPGGKQHYRFWQRGGGYDRNLRSLEDVYEKIHYIHANPVRRRLVEKADDWKWSSYRAWQSGEDIPLAIDRESLVM
jgi:putative transposase